MDDPQWEDSVEALRCREGVRAAQETGRLLAGVNDEWRNRVVARTSMNDLLFTVPGQGYPFDETVRVSWANDVFEFQLRAERGILIAADRCREPNAPMVLESFLAQLVGTE